MRRFLVSLGGLVLLVILVTTSGCARTGYPTGGPRDVDPPVVLNAKPANESHHFDANEFYLQFNEYVVLKNASENILVSPPMAQKPEFTTKGKGIRVKLNDTLQPNTTYLFQFKEAIADFTEGNLLPSYEYVFSTGDKMDTLTLEGRVLNARNGQPWKETLTVMAYAVETQPAASPNDTLGCSTQPDFITRCDKEGYFAFHYIPEGHYRVVALEDKNRNLRVDLSDAVAWDTAATASVTQQDSARVPLYFISTPENQQQRITGSSFTAPGHIVITCQCPLEQPSVEGLEAEWRLNSRKDTLTLWCLDAKLDTAHFIVSDPSGLQDTLKLRFTKKTKGIRRTQNAKEEKKPLIKILCDGSKAYYDDLQLAFVNPIVKQADSAQAEVMLLKDSTVSRYPIVLDSNGLGARIVASLKSEEQYQIHLDENLFTDLYGNSNDSLSFALTPKDYGILSIGIDNQTGNPLVVEVLDKRDTVVTSLPLNQSGTLRFIHLPGGEYRLRAVFDLNGDGRWTPGDYRLGRLPETSVMFDKTLQLREKWEIEEKWKVENQEWFEERTETKALAPKVIDASTATPKNKLKF